MEFPPPYTPVEGAAPQPYNPYFNNGAQVNSFDPNYRVICIGLSRRDRIELIGFQDKGLIDQMQNAIVSGWGRPIQQVAKLGENLIEIKISGNPWTGFGEDSVSARRLLSHVLICMAQSGWNLIQSADITKSQWDKDTLYFEPAQPDPETRMFAVSFNMSDRIRLIGCDELYPTLKEVVATYWAKGIQAEKHYAGSLEIKLKGTPFYEIGMGSSRAAAKFLLGQIIQAFRFKGYKLYTSCDISMGHEGRDLETWVFRKITPLYH